MSEAAITTVTDTYFASLAHKDATHPKCIVLFSGVPGSGKSYIARALEQELEAVRISNDGIRSLVAATDPTLDLIGRQEAKNEVVRRLLARLEQLSNGLLVFDNSCDRSGGYEFYRDWAAPQGYRIVLLRLNIPRDIIEQRYRDRGKHSAAAAANMFENLNGWWRQWEAFGKRMQPDLPITPEMPVADVVAFVRQALAS